MKTLALWSIRLYQKTLSQALPPSCRFVPSCSEYGYQAIAKYGCGGCHTIPGIQGANGTVGPNLAGVSKLPVIAGTSTQMTPENLVKWIMNPPSIKPGTTMPVLGVNQTDAQNIVAYLYTLQ